MMTQLPLNAPPSAASISMNSSVFIQGVSGVPGTGMGWTIA
jgi:hypothetical protein